jgi:hypothetical protein
VTRKGAPGGGRAGTKGRRARRCGAPRSLLPGSGPARAANVAGPTGLSPSGLGSERPRVLRGEQPRYRGVHGEQ